MTSNLSTFDKKWLQWVVLLIVMAILLIVGSAVYGAEEPLGRPLTDGEYFTYEADGLFIFKFIALISFSVEWEEVSEVCQQKLITGIAPFYCVSTDFGGTIIAEFLNKTNIGFFEENETCNLTENYTAGKTYVAYLVDFNNKFSATSTIEEIKSDNLRDKDEEPAIDEESIFITAELYDEVQYEWDFYLTIQPEIDITYPLDESEIIGTFEMIIDFWNAEDYDRLMITFEDWDIGSTCPLETDPNYQAERDIYFNSKSLPYFSSFLATSTGTTTIQVDSLEIGEYNCNRCYFLTTTGYVSENLCRGYRIDVLAYIPPADVPTYYLPISEWANYYAEHSERYPTSTPIFDSMAETFSPLIIWVGNTILFFNEYFDPEEAGNRGEEIGNAVSVARGYVESIDDFFGGLPISTIFIFYLITSIVIIVYRLVKGILTIIIP